MTGGTFSLTGGFWALEAVQTPGAPLLTILRTATNTVVVSWPLPATGWSLEQSTNLSTAVWGTPPETIQEDAANRFIIVNPPSGNRYYRLFKP
jgi:hypothetical protein